MADAPFCSIRVMQNAIAVPMKSRIQEFDSHILQGAVMKKALLLIYLAFMQTLAQASFSLSTVAEIGAPAAGFPDGYIYWKVDSPVIGRNGHLAFMGAADTSIYSTDANTNAVWAGLPGQLHVVLQENQSPIGFPASVVMDFAYERSLIVSNNGSVAFEANMRGSLSGRAYLAEVNGTAYGMLQAGMPAPNLPAGTRVQSLQDMAFTDAGAAILATTNDVNAYMAIWHWQNGSFTNVAKTGDSLAPIYPGCNVGGMKLVGMSNDGEIVFWSQVWPEDQTDTCPTGALLAWHNGEIRRVWDTSSVPSGLPTGTIFSILGSQSTNNVSLNDHGDVTFANMVSNSLLSASTIGAWMARADGTTLPVAFNGERVPGVSNETFQITYVQDVVVNNSGKAAFWARAQAGQVILAGPPDSNTYTTFDEIDASQLSLVVHSAHQPVGFGETW